MDRRYLRRCVGAWMVGWTLQWKEMSLYQMREIEERLRRSEESMKLPPLPDPVDSIAEPFGSSFLYDKDQMREYAAAAYRAGQEEMRERAAREVQVAAEKVVVVSIRALPVD